jgi:hypothetical protein
MLDNQEDDISLESSSSEEEKESRTSFNKPRPGL